MKKINQIDFEQIFIKICNAFDVSYDQKRNQMLEYYNSLLSSIDYYRFFKLIDRAKIELEVRPDKIPSIRQLWGLNKTIPFVEPKDIKKNKEPCPICDNTGFVPLQINGGRWDGYSGGVFACKCDVGRQKILITKMGREAGFYTAALVTGEFRRY